MQGQRTISGVKENKVFDIINKNNKNKTRLMFCNNKDV